MKPTYKQNIFKTTSTFKKNTLFLNTCQQRAHCWRRANGSLRAVGARNPT